MKKNIFILLFISILTLFISCKEKSKTEQDKSVKDVMDHVITRIYDQLSPDKYAKIDDVFMLDFLSEDEKSILATKYQYFKVNVPVTVSLIRNVVQQTVPFWLEASGFKKTDGIVKNDVYKYEVWQKDFEPGWVNLGINGFDMHRTVYFITVGAKNKNDILKVTDVYPSEFPMDTMGKGAYTYNDWDSLLITEFPKELEGQILFTSIRGRAREAHVTNGAFRKTPFPTSASPDQILLTWSKDPTNAIDIQWRTNTTVKNGIVKYWLKNSTDTLVSIANKIVIEDRMLYNDRYIHRFTANLENLKPDSNYAYLVGSKENNNWSAVNSFKTEKTNLDKFSFVWFGDTHIDPKWAEMLQDANKLHKETAFYSIAGDIVKDGLFRSDWDQLFGISKDVFSNIPLMPVPGNHDRQDGLGARFYYELFSLPKNGPEKVHPESTYAFNYGNALFLMIDSTHPIDDQTEWIEEQLKNSKAKWKFAMFHFPPYNFFEPYYDIQEAWGGVFDKYHVDMVMSGHEHYYMRSKPMFEGKVVDSFKNGTVYVISIGTTGNNKEFEKEPYAETSFQDGQFYQNMTIDKNILKYTTYNNEGKIVDEFTIKK